MFKWIYKFTNKLKEKVATLSDKMSEKGQGLTEYAVLLAAVAIIAFAALYGSGNDGLKKSITDLFGTAKTKIDAANTSNNPTP